VGGYASPTPIPKPAARARPIIICFCGAEWSYLHQTKVTIHLILSDPEVHWRIYYLFWFVQGIGGFGWYPPILKELHGRYPRWDWSAIALKRKTWKRVAWQNLQRAPCLCSPIVDSTCTSFQFVYYLSDAHYTTYSIATIIPGTPHEVDFAFHRTTASNLSFTDVPKTFKLKYKKTILHWDRDELKPVA